MLNEINFYPVKISILPDISNNELSDKIIKNCSFCNDDVEMNFYNKEILSSLSNDFCCNFCVRNKFNVKNNDILMLNFHSILKFFYYEFYLLDRQKRMSFSEIIDYINVHELTGTSNPIFYYNSNNFNWFIDFSRVGNDKYQISIDEVFKTVLNILVCFNLWKNIPDLKMHVFYEKYRKSIELFYNKRIYASNKRIISPTFEGCGVIEKCKNFIDNTSAFSIKKICLNQKNFK